MKYHSSIQLLAALGLAMSTSAYGGTLTQGPSSSQAPSLIPGNFGGSGISVTSIISAGDSVGGYTMAGIPDGLGAFDNGNGTFTVLMNHEIGDTLGVVRAHGAKGGFISKWVINKSDFSVVSGSDLITSVIGWDTANQVSGSAVTKAFNRLCSADLPAVSAFYNSNTGLGSQERIFMSGEESGSAGWLQGNVVTGSDAGKSYQLGKFNLATNNSGISAVGGWENALANPFAQDKTVVIGNNDGGTGIMQNSVAVYVGTKQATGTEVEKAGLMNGTLKFVNIAGMAVEGSTSRGATALPATPAPGAAFTLSATTSTTFLRPEDGAWDPANPSKYYFVTTDRYDATKDGLAGNNGFSRLWRLNFTDITNPDLGGTTDLLLDGTEAGQMFDNLTVDGNGNVILQEDVGNNQHNGKIWTYNPTNDSLTPLVMHDPVRFGDIGSNGTVTNDEEGSGIIDITKIITGTEAGGVRYYLTSDQLHNSVGGAVVEGGQLLVVATPEPGRAMLLVAGLGAMALRRRRK